MKTLDDRLFELSALLDQADKYKLVSGNKDLMEFLCTNSGFMTAPASTKYHGNYPGGLFDHSYAMANTLFELTTNNNLVWQRPESPLIVGLFHDLCKCDQYIKVLGNSDTPDIQYTSSYHYEYNSKLLLKGHGDKSVMILSQFMRLTEEEVLCIRYHMGAYEKDDWEGFDLAIRKFPTVLWTHTADMIASKVIGT